MPSEDRPFHCQVCRRSFRSHSGLKSHMNEHAARWQCRLCGKRLQENEYHRC
jgi:transcription elongation factor Elf1